MKNRKYLTLLLPLAFILLCRQDRGIADFYALRLYPTISGLLSHISSRFPFSLEEIIVVGIVYSMVRAVVVGIRRKHKALRILGKELRIILWTVAWFYLGWGINYFRSSLPERMETPLARYDEARFKAFLEGYAGKLNGTYQDNGTIDLGQASDGPGGKDGREGKAGKGGKDGRGGREAFPNLARDVRNFYGKVDRKAGLARPRRWQQPKTALASGLFSKVGVTGSMGPFMSESLLNGDMPASEYPFTFAHEFAHLMGVSSEAEANYWAFRFCESSNDPAVQYSGYLTLLGNILRNASALLSEEDFAAFSASIDDRVKADFNARSEYWSQKYSRLLGSIQNAMYNAYLKGNGISSGTRNYDEVLGLLMTEF